MKLKIKKLSDAAITPRYATPGSACFDLHAVHNGVVPAGKSMAFATDLAFEVPDGWVMKLYSRSGHGFRHGVRLANTTGIIDSDYRGEILVPLTCDAESETGYFVAAGDRIAQAMLVQVPQVQLVEVEELSDTARGAGGFGSTGS